MNGPAAGVGLALACFADLRFAVPGVKFTTAHGKLNLPAEYGLSGCYQRLSVLAVLTTYSLPAESSPAMKPFPWAL